MSKEAISVDIRAIVASNIKRFCEEKHKTRQDISNDLNIKYTTLCDWFNGNSSPKLESLYDLSRYLGVEVGDFFIDFDHDSSAVARLSEYAKRAVTLDMKILDSLSDEQIMELIKRGFTFKHKTLEEYIAENNGEFKVSREFDWGEPVGREIW
jgi:transcriptional regulator with XRE-family HTH domain